MFLDTQKIIDEYRADGGLKWESPNEEIAALYDRLDTIDQLWLDLKEALGYKREFPVDIDGMIREVDNLYQAALERSEFD